VQAVDGHCRAPGCTVPAHRCDLDHDIPAPHGPTSTDNLSATHRQHHRIRTTGLWTTHRDPDIGTLTWTTAAGRTYTTHPKDWLEHHRTPVDAHPRERRNGERPRPQGEPRPPNRAGRDEPPF
ncbi:HNH endonuclease signature motif containing protein, partial [Monashia sp. NPDC004114]